METTEKTDKKERPLKWMREEMEKRFKKKCDECQKIHNEQLKFKDSKHAKDYGELLKQKESDRKWFEEKTDEYYKEMSSKWRRTKHFRKFVIVVLIMFGAIIGNVFQVVHNSKNTRKMNVYNTALKYLQDANPKIDYGRLVRVIERPEIEPEWHKEIKKITNKYEDLWWLK
jgi:hypothetical protein